MTDDIVWEDPPETALNSRRRSGYTDFAEALNRNPGKWAVLPGSRKSPESAKNAAQNIRRGVMRDFPKDQFEAVVDGVKIYVRRAVRVQGAQPQTPEPEPEPGEANGWEARRVRLWAQENGYEIGDRGRIKDEVLAAYDKAHSQG